jgi:hypothetical protein
MQHLDDSSAIRLALQRVGELLAADGEPIAVVLIGGAALNLLHIIERPTIDVDILAFARSEDGAAPRAESIQPPPEPMPERLRLAAAQVARDLGLPSDWLNTGPALQWRAGLPPGLPARVQWHRFAGLWVGLVDRRDLIFFKLFAAADAVGPRSVHYQDLLRLRPTAAELADAATWVATQDAAVAFARVLARVVAHCRTDLVLKEA